MRTRKFRWWGLYALLPLMIGLIVLDDETPMSGTWHLIVLVAIAAIISVLALAWVERNARLVETDGIDGTCIYRILLDTADGLSVQTITREMGSAREKTPVAKRATDVRSPTCQTIAADARDL